MVPLVKRRLTGQIAGMVGAYGNVGAVLFLTAYSFVDASTFFVIIGLTAIVAVILIGLIMNEPSGQKEAPGALVVTVGQCTRAGRKPQNEDSLGVLVPEGDLLHTKGLAAVICDGMSGCEAGKEASTLAVQSFLDDYFSTPDSWTVKTSVTKVLTALNSWLYSQGQRQYETAKGMVTTFSAMVPTIAVSWSIPVRCCYLPPMECMISSPIGAWPSW